MADKLDRPQASKADKLDRPQASLADKLDRHQASLADDFLILSASEVNVTTVISPGVLATQLPSGQW